MSRDKKSNYYDQGGIEVQDVIKAKLTPEQYEGWLLGNVIKYSLRCNWKGSKERDHEKIVNYSLWLMDETGGTGEAEGEGYRACITCGYYYCDPEDSVCSSCDPTLKNYIKK